MRPRSTNHGYDRVYLRRESTGKREDLYIHRIVAKLFVPNPKNAEEVNHLDCNTHNNSASNLEWVTREENLGYAVVYGFMTRDALGRFCRKLA